jgi:hypothetical protein
MPVVAGLIIVGEILFFLACAVILIYLMVKRYNQKKDFDEREN